MKEKKGKRLWGGMKGKPNERGQTDDSPNLIEKPVAKAWFACKYATREVGEGRGGGEKKEGEKELRHRRPRTHQKGRAPSYDEASRDIQGRR